MFKSRSFRLVNEDESKKRERLYEPKRIRWMKYIVIPALIGFILLLILTNVDFSGELYEAKPETTTISIPEVTTITAVAAIKIMPRSNSAIPEAAEMSAAHALPSATTSGEGATVRAITGYRCEEKIHCKTLVCYGGPIYAVNSQIEDFAKFCSTDTLFTILIENCTFYKDTIGTYTLSGYYTANALTIRNCTLKTITANAFKNAAMKPLTDLTFLQTQLTSLNDKAFVGLSKLTHFTLKNVEEAWERFSGTSFLMPFASTLKSLVIQQRLLTPFDAITRTSNSYDPAEWLSGYELAVLTFVDLHGNNFNATLNADTFANMPLVQQLLLSDCNIVAIGLGTFDRVLQTLELLDLSDNALTTLDADLVHTIALAGVKIELDGNAWQCDCENYVLIKLLAEDALSLGNQPICTSPSEWYGTQMKLVQLDICFASVITTSVTTTSMTTKASTTTSPLFTTTSIATATTSNTLATTPSTDPTPISDSSNTEPTLETSKESTITSAVTANSSLTEENTTTSITKTTHNNSLTEESTTTSITKTTHNITSTQPQPTTLPSNSSTTNTLPETQETDETDETIDTTESIETTESSEESISTTPGEIFTSLPPPTPPTPPTPPPECYRQQGGIYCSSRVTAICDYDAIFNVYLIAPHSVMLNVSSATYNLQVVGFTTTNETALTLQIPQNSKGGSVVINDLKYHLSYTFCLRPINQVKVSPFDCRSIYVPPLQPNAAWLTTSDQAVFFTVGSVCVLICLIVGLLAVYWVLRWRPVWLRGSKRLRRIASTSQEMLLFPKSDRASMDSKQLTFSELAKMNASASDTLTPQNCFNVQSYDYMQYYKDMERNKRRKFTRSNENQPPMHRAPALPPNEARCSGSGYGDERSGSVYIERQCTLPTATRLKRTVPGQDIGTLEQGYGTGDNNYKTPRRQFNVYYNENEYESLDYYQEIYQ